MHNPLNLTFGVEIECIVSFDPKTYEDILSQAEGILWQKEEQPATKYSRDSGLRTLLRRHVTEVLSKEGFPAYAVTSTEGDQKWTVTNDTSIITNDHPGEKGFLECDVEIKSPAMRLRPKALRRVNDVLCLLTSQFNMYVNASCGLHVHIGNQRAGFPLQTLKNLSMLTAMFEHQLDSFHPSDRLGSLHAKGPSKAFKGQNPWDTVQVIQNCVTKKQLLLLYANEEGLDRNFAYNISSMAAGLRKTIEFRQHEGTLDAMKIINWVQVAGGLVNAMHEINGFELGRLISDNAFDPRYTAIDLLRRLKMENLVSYYEGRLHTHPRPEPVWVAGSARGKSEAVPRVHSSDDWWGMENQYTFDSRWEKMEGRHKLERIRELKKLEELEFIRELERRWELERKGEIAVEKPFCKHRDLE